jgi:hypothetical protein
MEEETADVALLHTEWRITTGISPHPRDAINMFMLKRVKLHIRVYDADNS